MCGIATISIGRRCRGRIPYHTLRDLVAELLVELEVRGVEASGIAVINEDKPDVNSVVFKKPLRASRFVNRPRFEDALETIDKNTNFILLHARATTVGNTSNNFNNHPIVIPPIVGIHNGTLENHEALFRKYESSFKQEGEVDSEIILRLYQHYTDRVGLGPQEALRATSSELKGAYTGALIDMRNRHRMVMFKFRRELHAFLLPYYDIVLTISEAALYDSACKILKIKTKDEWKVVKEGTGLLMDLNTPGRIVENVVPFDIPVDRSMGWGQQYARWLEIGLHG